MSKAHEIMLSVIIPIYNIEQYLPRCVESVLNQTYKNLQIILVDDGSSDSCGSLCDQYGEMDKRVLVLHGNNEGLVRARKRGLEKAQGEYTAFVDGDDWIEKNMYEDLLNVLQKTGADFVDSGHFIENDGVQNIRKIDSNLYQMDADKKHKLYMNLLELDDTISMYPSIWSKVFKTELIRKCYEKVPDEKQYGEDVISLIYCISEANVICQVDSVYYHYCYRDNSLSREKSYKQIKKYYALWKFCGELVINRDRFVSRQEIDKMLFDKLRTELIGWNDNEDGMIQRYVFPNIELLYDKKIIVYGAGRVGIDYITQISKYTRCNIVCWVDKQYEKCHFAYRDVNAVEQIMYIEFDIVVLAVKEQKISEEIKQKLTKMGIPLNKVLWYKPQRLY